MRRTILAAALVPVLAGCQTVYKQVPTITSAEATTSVRFARGDALLMSDGSSGIVWLRPIRYYSGNKIFFEVVAFNRTNTPVNFGTEDIALATGDGIPLRAQEWDELQHHAHKRNPFGRLGEQISRDLTAWHLTAVAKRTPDRATIWRRGDHQYYASREAIQYQLEDAVLRYSMETLQTTTVDPFTTFGGVVYADNVVVRRGGVRELLANVRFAGEDHRFRLRIAVEGTPTPVQVGLPAVTRASVEATRAACQTWMWDHPGQPCHAGTVRP